MANLVVCVTEREGVRESAGVQMSKHARECKSREHDSGREARVCVCVSVCSMQGSFAFEATQGVAKTD